MQALGDIVLILPLLVMVATRVDRWSPGPFGTDWWILPVTTVLGLFILLTVLLRLLHLLRTTRTALGMGHGLLTVAQVAIDVQKDVGFLLQGGRMYSHLDADTRGSILRLRLIGAACYSAAALWIPLGFILALFIAGHGTIGTSTMWNITIVPAVILVLTAFIIRLIAGGRSGTAGWKIRRTAAEIEAAGLVGDWAEDYDRLDERLASDRGPAADERVFRFAWVFFTTSTVVILTPILILVFGGSIAPLITQVSMPRFAGVEEKILRIDYMREYRLAPDFTVTAVEAGDALHALVMTGSRMPAEWHIRLPAREYTTDLSRRRFRSSNLFERFLNDDMEAGELHYYTEMSAHPALEEFHLLGRSAEANIADSRWSIPFPDTLTWGNFVIPRMQGVTGAARIKIVSAAMEFEAGERLDAETHIREVISTGFLMIDEDPTLIGNLIGTVLVGYGKEALQSLFMVSGRFEEAEQMHALGDEIDRVITRSRSFRGRMDEVTNLQQVADLVSNENTLRGLRWELLPQLTTIAPVTSLHKAVFGTDLDYAEWLLDVESSLVRWPAEQELFERLRLGWMTSPSNLKKRGLLEFAFGLVFGKSGVPGSLAGSIRALQW